VTKISLFLCRNRQNSNFLTTGLRRKPHAFQRNLVCVEPYNQSASILLQLESQKWLAALEMFPDFRWPFTTQALLTCEKNSFCLYLLCLVCFEAWKSKKNNFNFKTYGGKWRRAGLFSLKRQFKFYAGKQPMKTGCFSSGTSTESKREVFCQHNNHSGSHVHNVEKEKYSNGKVYSTKGNSQIQEHFQVYKYKKCKIRITGQMVLKTKYNISKLSSMLRISSHFVYLRDNSENLHNREKDLLMIS